MFYLILLVQLTNRYNMLISSRLKRDYMSYSIIAVDGCILSCIFVIYAIIKIDKS